MKRIKWLGVASLVLAVLIGIHQLVIAGKFFEIKDMLHHEFLMALAGAFGLGVLIQEYY